MAGSNDEFIPLFKGYMASAEAWKPLANFINTRKENDLRECLEIFFVVANDYDIRDDRSQKTFFVLCLKLLTDSDFYFALRFEVLVQRKNTPWPKHYSALDSGFRNQLNARKERKKAGLSYIQKKFIKSFPIYVKSMDLADFQNFAEKQKFPELRDCLLVYMEISQQLPDDEKNSLKIFYALSFYTLAAGGMSFAQQYEKDVRTEGKIWKRRYDALEWWQREQKLEPIIREQQTVATADFQYKGKDVILKHKVPNTAPEKPADPEDERPAAAMTKLQIDFIKQFHAFMDARDKKSVVKFTEHIFSLEAPKVQECLEAYLQAAKTYDNRDQQTRDKSLYIFFGLAGIAIGRGDAYYAFKFKTKIDTPGTKLAGRYEALKPEQQKDLDREIARKLALKCQRLIDQLKIAYFQKHHKDPDLQALRKFYIPVGQDLNERLSKHLSTCNLGFAVHNFERFQEGFDALSEQLHAQKDLVVFYGLLQRCRSAGNIEPGLRRLLYWYMAGTLYVQALIQRPEIYQTGLKEEEIDLLFDDSDRKSQYFSDFALQLDHLWIKRQSHAEFTKISKAYLGVHLYADHIKMRFVPLEEAAAVRGLVEVLQKKKPEVISKIDIPIPNRFGNIVNLKIYNSFGDLFIVWVNDDVLVEVYVEIEGFEGLLFGASLDRLALAYDHDSVIAEIVRRTGFLITIMPYLFAFLTLIPDLVTGGLSGLIKGVIIDIAIERTASALGLNETALQLVLAGAGFLRQGMSSVRSKGRAKAFSGNGTDHPGIDSRALANSLGDAGHTNKGTLDRLTGDTGVDAPPAGRTQADLHADRPPDAKVQTGTADNAAGSPLVSANATAGTGARSTAQPPPIPATRQDLHLAQQRVKEARAQLETAHTDLERAKMRTFDAQDRLGSAKTKTAEKNFKTEYDRAQAAEARARMEYKNKKYELRAAESTVERVTNDLGRRGQLDPVFIKKWYLPSKPVKFRRGVIEVDSWSPAGFVGTKPDRRTWERILQQEPNGELSKRLLDPNSSPNPSQRTLYPANVGNANHWQQHPEMVELAHILTRSDGGPDVYILMTKDRNQWYGRNIERTGAVFTLEAIVVQGIAIERQSAIALGIPNAATTKNVIRFGE